MSELVLNPTETKKTFKSVKIGEVSWDDPSMNFDKKPEVKKDDANKMEYVKISEAGNQLRMIAGPFEYVTHEKVFFPEYNLDPKKVPEYGFTVRCSLLGPDGKCPICDRNEGKTEKEDINRFIKKWYFGVIERTLDGDENVDHNLDKVKILDCKKSVVGKIQDIRKSGKKYNNPSGYDIKVRKNPKADAPANYYIVTPDQISPLTETEIKMQMEFDKDRLVAMTTSPTYDEVVTRISNIVKYNSPKSDKPAGQIKAAEVTSETPASEAASAAYTFAQS